MKDTRFNKENAAENGRRGGIRAGETKRARAERRELATGILADAVYRVYLENVTAEELRAFIRWRGQQKRKATLARKALALDDETRGCTDHLLSCRMYCTLKGSARELLRGGGLYSFTDALALAGSPEEVLFVFDQLIDDIFNVLAKMGKQQRDAARAGDA